MLHLFPFPHCVVAVVCVCVHAVCARSTCVWLRRSLPSISDSTHCGSVGLSRSFSAGERLSLSVFPVSSSSSTWMSKESRGSFYALQSPSSFI